jgi:hypothetical protein
MTDLDLVAALRRDSGDYGRAQTDPVGSYEWDQRDVRAWEAADRIEALEVERDALDKQVWRMRALRTDDSAERTLTAAEARADRAEARLARVTDDSMVEQVASVLAMSYGSHVSPPKGGRDWKAAEDVLATIRAVAADEQRSFAEAIAPITKQSKQWADAVAAGEQAFGERPPTVF